MTLRKFVSSALLGCCLTSGAWADEWYGDWYLSGGIGWNYADSVTLEPNDTKLEIDRGRYLPTGALGLRFRDKWRVELDASVRKNTPEILYSAAAGIEVDPDGQDLLKARSLMINVLHDFSIGSAWRPYLGAGIGAAKLDYHLSEIGVDGPNLQRPRRDIVNDSSTTFAYQMIMGFTVPITKRLDLAADYRYWRTPSPGLEDTSGANLKIDHTVHSAWLHLRYHAPSAGVLKAPVSREQAPSPFYVKASLGGGFFEDAGVADTEIGVDAFGLGPTGSLALGYVWRQHLRLELEAAYRSSEVEVIDFRPDKGEDAANGKASHYSLMANAIYQFAPSSTIQPFAGIGGGFVHSSFNINVLTICEFYTCGVPSQAKLVDDKDNARAIQAIFGVDVVISPRTKFFADYRYWVTSDFKGLRQPDGADFNTYLRNTSVMVGFRYALGSKS